MRPRPDPRRRAGAALVFLLVGTAAAGCSRTPDRPAAAGAPRAPLPGAGPSDAAVYDVGVRPVAVAVADLDGDGRPDAAVANGGDGTVSVLPGDGAGRLGRGGAYAAGSEPSDVDAADLDRDGDPDLVVANHETPRVTVLLNDGRGRFAPAPGSPYDTGARPHVHGVATGDFDGDGWVDVAVESADAGEVRLLRGGPRGLSPAAGVAVGTSPYFRLGAGDVDGDGRPEVLVPGHGDNTVRAVTGDGGRFRPAPWSIRLGRQPWMVVGGDVNGDGRDDLAVVESDGVSVWLSSGRGFAPAPGSPHSVPGATQAAMGDLDGDGAADVAVGPWEGDEVTVLAGGGPAVSRVRTCERPVGLAIADLDRDGRGELLATCPTRNLLVVARTNAP